MRRPVDWIVVSISMMLLAANRMLVADPVVEPTSASPVLRDQRIAREPPAPTSPFAYVRKDGTQVYLPIPAATGEDEVASLGMALEDLQASRGLAYSAELEPALYSWSSPAGQSIAP
jgi:hypothetical protein